MLSIFYIMIYIRLQFWLNLANLRDLKAATGLVILLHLDSNHWFLFIRCDLSMAFKYNRAPLLCYIKLCALFHSTHWIQTRGIIQKCSIQVKIDHFHSMWPLNFTDVLEKKIGNIFYAISNCVHQLVVIVQFKLELNRWGRMTHICVK